MSKILIAILVCIASYLFGAITILKIQDQKIFEFLPVKQRRTHRIDYTR